MQCVLIGARAEGCDASRPQKLLGEACLQSEIVTDFDSSQRPEWQLRVRRLRRARALVRRSHPPNSLGRSSAEALVLGLVF